MNNNSFFNDLLREYGIFFDQIKENTIDDFIKKGFEKIPDEAKENINAIFQYFPGLAAEALGAKDAIGKSKELLDGAYKISITEGMHLAKSRASKNAFRGALLSNSSNQVAGQAELFKVEDSIKLIQAPKYALCVFDAVSAITGQYYMAEINHKLSAIEDKTDRILEYLESTTRGELWASDQILNEVLRNLGIIKENETQKAAYYQQVLTVKKDVLAKMKLFNLQINASRQKVNSKSKPDEIENLIKLVGDYYPQYWYTIYLYEKSVFCEIGLGDIEDPILLESMKNDVLGYIDDYMRAFESDRIELYEIVNNAKKLNLKKIPQLKDYIGVPNTLLFQLYELFAMTENIVSDKREERKKALQDRIKKGMEDLGDTALLADQIRRIDDYIAKKTEAIDVVKIGDDILIKYNETEDN